MFCRTISEHLSTFLYHVLLVDFQNRSIAGAWKTNGICSAHNQGTLY